MTKNIPWNRLLVEAMVIVVSIIFAFVIDAWWEARNASSRQQEMFKLLHSDFSLSLEGLLTSIERGETLVNNGTALLTALDSPEQSGEATLRRLFPSISRPVASALSPVSYQAALMSNEINIIDNIELLRSFTLIDIAVANSDEHRRVAADNFYTGLLAEVGSTIGGLRTLSSTNVPSRFIPTDYIEMASRPGIYAASEKTVTVNQNLLRALNQMKFAMESAITALESELQLSR